MRILGYDYECASSNLIDMNSIVGLCDLDKLHITIARDIPVDGQISVVLHEIIEAINYHLELKLKHHQISSLESGLFQVLKDNGVDLSPILKKFPD